MTEMKISKISDEALEQISGGINTKNVALIAKLTATAVAIAAGILGVSVAWKLSKETNTETEIQDLTSDKGSWSCGFEWTKGVLF